MVKLRQKVRFFCLFLLVFLKKGDFNMIGSIPSIISFIISECYTLFYALTVAILLIVTRMPVMIPAIGMIIFNLIRARKE